jgi:hypothetical protein
LFAKAPDNPEPSLFLQIFVLLYFPYKHSEEIENLLWRMKYEEKRFLERSENLIPYRIRLCAQQKISLSHNAHTHPCSFDMTNFREINLCAFNDQPLCP